MTDIERTIEETKAGLLPFESWERLAGESGAAYAAFAVYRDYGLERNIRKAVAATEKDEAKQGKRYRVWRNWSTAFRWRERAADYDGYVAKLQQAEVRKTIEEQGRVHRMVTGKMLQVVNKKLDLMNPDDLSHGTITEWVETAIRTERDIAGLTVTKHERDKTGNNGRLEIQFAPDFEGL
jgi:hypothetical protein